MDITRDTLISMIENTAQARVELESKLQDLRGQVAQLERESDNLTLEMRGYELTLRRLFPDDEATATAINLPPRGSRHASEPHLELSLMNRAEAVHYTVRELTKDGSPASPADIERFMKERGRSDNRDQIGAALAYLNKRDIVERASRAQWRLWTGKGIDDHLS